MKDIFAAIDEVLAANDAPLAPTRCTYGGCAEVLYSWLNPTDACSPEHRLDESVRPKPMIAVDVEGYAVASFAELYQRRTVRRANQLVVVGDTLSEGERVTVNVARGYWTQGRAVGRSMREDTWLTCDD